MDTHIQTHKCTDAHTHRNKHIATHTCQQMCRFALHRHEYRHGYTHADPQMHTCTDLATNTHVAQEHRNTDDDPPTPRHVCRYPYRFFSFCNLEPHNSRLMSAHAEATMPSLSAHPEVNDVYALRRFRVATMSCYLVVSCTSAARLGSKVHRIKGAYNQRCIGSKVHGCNGF